MRNIVLGRMSYQQIAKVGAFFAMGLVSRRAKAAAHHEVFTTLADMGLPGLYRAILDHSGAQINRALRVCADRRNHPVRGRVVAAVWPRGCGHHSRAYTHTHACSSGRRGARFSFTARTARTARGLRPR